MTRPVPPIPEEEEDEQLSSTEITPAREGCGRAGCGFLLGVVGSALVTLAILATVLTRGHPLSVVSRLLNGRDATPTPTASLPSSSAVEGTRAEEAATRADNSGPTPTFIPVPTAVPTSTPTPTATPSPTVTPTPTPMIALRQVNQLGRYESMQFIVQTVVDLAREPDNFWERICGSDELLLIAGGEAIAGFDLSKVAPGDLQVDGRRLRLSLPPAEVFSYFVKEDQTYVYQRNTGVLCRADPNLETEARREAEQRVLHYALEQGILERAEKAGLTQLEAFFRDLGFEQVELVVKPAD